MSNVRRTKEDVAREKVQEIYERAKDPEFKITREALEWLCESYFEHEKEIKRLGTLLDHEPMEKFSFN